MSLGDQLMTPPGRAVPHGALRWRGGNERTAPFQQINGPPSGEANLTSFLLSNCKFVQPRLLSFSPSFPLSLPALCFLCRSECATRFLSLRYPKVDLYRISKPHTFRPSYLVPGSFVDGFQRTTCIFAQLLGSLEVCPTLPKWLM